MPDLVVVATITRIPPAFNGEHIKIEDPQRVILLVASFPNALSDMRSPRWRQWSSVRRRFSRGPSCRSP